MSFAQQGALTVLKKLIVAYNQERGRVTSFCNGRTNYVLTNYVAVILIWYWDVITEQSIELVIWYEDAGKGLLKCFSTDESYSSLWSSRPGRAVTCALYQFLLRSKQSASLCVVWGENTSQNLYDVCEIPSFQRGVFKVSLLGSFRDVGWY